MLVVPQTEVRLLNNVPLNISYEHQMTFASKTAQANYFIGKTQQSFQDFTYVKEDSTIRVPMGRDSLYSCNYVMFRNEDFSNKWFYGFITKLEYVNPNTTKIHFEMDVFQTWQFDFTFRPSYVEREHTKRWNSDGSPVLNTVDEGLHYGDEYKTVSVTQYVPYHDIFFLVIVATERMDVNGEGVTPTLNGSPQPLSYYIHPFKMDGSTPRVMIDGTEYGAISNINDVLKSLYKQEGAVNNIANLYITEYPGINFGDALGGISLSMANFDPVTIQDDASGDSFHTLYVKRIPTYQERTENFYDKYTGFTQVDESKLLMYPYTVTVISDMKGNQQEIKNEYIEGNDLEIVTKGSLGVGNKVSYNVKNYLMSGTLPNGNEVAIADGVINNSPNEVPIITDLLSAYLQGNRNTIENQRNAIQFNTIANVLGNAFATIGSAMSRNPVGAVSGIASIGMGAVNSYFELEAINAKHKDLDATPSQLNKLGGNTAFDYGNDIKGLYIIKKEITPEYRKKLTDFFKMYGYKVNELKTPNLKSRQHFNFIKTVGANVTGNVPQDDLAVIKRMFDNGVTLWHGDWVGDYSRPNGEV